MKWRRKCVVCGRGLRSTAARCYACKRLSKAIRLVHGKDIRCQQPHPEQAARLRRYAERAARQEPLFDGTERR